MPRGKYSEERFTVSTAGMRELHAGREPWRLVKELVANVWDEDQATLCEVKIVPAVRGMEISVEDDGPGFANIDDAYTLLGASPKRGRPDVRGRFNVGEKEIISVAREARIETVGFTVEFPRSGGRRVAKNDRMKGTVVTVLMPWTRDEMSSLVFHLSEFLPSERLTYVVDGNRIPYRKPVVIREAKLETVVQSAPGAPLTRSMRQTEIRLHQVGMGNDAWLYEMGIPVQKIDGLYHVDVGQKSPLSQNRDSVPDRYLRDIYAEVLTATVDRLPETKAAETWVRRALEDERTTPEVAKVVVERRFGEKVVFWSSDGSANERAQEAGYSIVHPRTLSYDEREKIRDAGVQSASEKFGRNVVDAAPVASMTPGMERVGVYAKWLARKLIDLDISVTFRSWPSSVRAQYGMRTLTFNVGNLGPGFFETGSSGLPTVEQTALIIHELAHEGDAEMPHHGEYVHRLAELGAKAAHLALFTNLQEWGGEAASCVVESRR